MREAALPELRADLRIIADLVAPRARVLDIGCGDGALLAHLAVEKGVDARGIELDMAGVAAAVARGAAVIQGDADRDLETYPDGAFDYAILSQTIQATHRPAEVLRQLVRISRRAIVSLPNFGYWRTRLSLLTRGRMPVTRNLPAAWFETPNIHLCTIQDFEDLCRMAGHHIDRSIYVRNEKVLDPSIMPNLFAQQAVFVVRGNRHSI